MTSSRLIKRTATEEIYDDRACPVLRQIVIRARSTPVRQVRGDSVLAEGEARRRAEAEGSAELTGRRVP